MTFVQVTQPRVTSKDASNKTRTNRSKMLVSLRHSVSKGQSSSQLSNEVKQMPAEDREAIATAFESDPGHLKVAIPTTTSVAFMSDLKITWSKLDCMRR